MQIIKNGLKIILNFAFTSLLTIAVTRNVKRMFIISITNTICSFGISTGINKLFTLKAQKDIETTIAI